LYTKIGEQADSEMVGHSTHRKVKVLVVDDDVDVCEHLESLLTTKNYIVKYTTDPGVTVSILKDEMFQIIILDLIMPKISGLELLKRIREVDSDVCVIILSGYPTFDRAVAALRGLAFDFLTKPFEEDELTSVLDKAVRLRGLRTNLNQQAIERIAEEIRRLRTSHKLTLKQLGNRSGLSPSLIFQVEHAQTSPSIATLSRLAAALDARLEQFFEGL